MKRTFTQWLCLVDEALDKFGMHHLDLSDWDYAGAYADGISPANAAHRAMKAAGTE